MRVLLLATLLVLTAALPARAQDSLPPPDQVVLNVTEEAWVETETARVIAQIKTLITNAAAGDAAANPTAILDKVGLGQWHITGSYRQQTDTGYEQLLITAETRLAQSKLPGIYERAKAASEKGRTVQVLAIDFSPSLDEREATAAKLRQAIYARAAAEAKAVSAQFPDQGFRVHQVQFQGGPGVPVPMPARSVRAKTMMLQADAGGAESGQQVSERLTLSATVVIAAPGQ
jgi:uncharacterized protein YggE